MTQRDLDIIASWGVTLPPTSLPLPYSFEGETPHPDHVVALPRPVGEAAGEAFATAKNAIPKGCPVDFKETGFCVY